MRKLTTRESILLSSYMKGWAVGADRLKTMSHRLSQDKELELAWGTGFQEGRKIALAAQASRTSLLMATPDRTAKEA